MKRKFLVEFLAIVASFCMVFGFVACGETENSGNTGGGSQEQQQPGGSQSGGTTKPDDGQGGETPHVHSYGDWHTTEEATCTKAGRKQRECSCGDVQYDTVPQKDHSFVNCVCSVCGAVESGAVEVKVYIDNVLTETLYTSESKGYKIALPAKPADTTTDPNLTNYFDGWYADKGCTKQLTGEETYSAPSAIYGQNIANKGWGCQFEVSKGEVTITVIAPMSSMPSPDLVVPAYYNSYPVTRIGKNAAKDMSMIRNLYLCENLKEIEDSAFYNCNSMQKVVLPSSLTSIGSYAFYGCSSLQSVTIPDSVTSIGGYAFCHCSGLQSVTFGDNSKLTSIGYYAFEDCSGLTSVTIGSGVTKIGSSAFEGCSKLASVIWNAKKCTEAGSHTYDYDWTIFKNCENLSSVTFGKNVEKIPAYTFYGCGGLKEVHISDLAAWCRIDFENSSSNPLCYAHYLYLNNVEIKNLTIPSNIKEIKASAFEGCSGLTGELKIPDSVTLIGDSAFKDCSGLTSVTIGSGVTSIGEDAFDGCSGLEKFIVDIGNTTYSSQDGVLYNKTKSTILLAPEGIKGTINIPESVTSIGENTFYDCSKLERIDVAEKNSRYSSQDGIVYDKNKTKIIYVPLGINGAVTIPKGVTELTGFYNRINLQSVSFENDSSLRSIGAYAFGGCTGLQSITIPKKCIVIGREAFTECTSLSEAIFEEPEGWYYTEAYYDWNLNYHENTYYLSADKLRDKKTAAGLIKNDHTLQREN